MTIQEKIADLRRVAEKATPGPWVERGSWYIENIEGVRYAEAYSAQDIKHIAAFNPVQVMALLDALQIALIDLDKIADGNMPWDRVNLAKLALAEIQKVLGI